MKSTLLLSVAFIITAGGRELQQAAGPVQELSLASRPNSNAASRVSQHSLYSRNSNTGAATTQEVIQPTNTDKRTLEQVNADAPTFTDPSSQATVKPVATSLLAQEQGQDASAPNTAQNTVTATAQPDSGSQKVGVVNPYDVIGAQPLDQNIASGDYISQQVGVRVATPFFGTGLYFCVGEHALHPPCLLWHCKAAGHPWLMCGASTPCPSPLSLPVQWGQAMRSRFSAVGMCWVQIGTLGASPKWAL